MQFPKLVKLNRSTQMTHTCTLRTEVEERRVTRPLVLLPPTFKIGLLQVSSMDWAVVNGEYARTQTVIIEATMGRHLGKWDGRRMGHQEGWVALKRHRCHAQSWLSPLLPVDSHFRALQQFGFTSCNGVLIMAFTKCFLVQDLYMEEIIEQLALCWV